MPAAAEILDSLRAITNDWRLLAMLWHGYFGLIILRLLLNDKPSRRLIAVSLSLPFLSVGTLALLAGNEFNSRVFVLGFVLLNLAAVMIPPGRINMASAWYSIPGGLLFLFGWIYPHFLQTESHMAYLYAAPLGLIPCPTLSALIGIALVLKGFESFTWSLLLALAGLFYGLFGALYLQIMVDWLLFIGALLLLFSISHYRLRDRQRA